MLIINVDRFLDEILSIIEEELMTSSMHQNYFFIEKDELKKIIKFCLDINDEKTYDCFNTREEYLH